MADSKLWAFLRPRLEGRKFTDRGGHAQLRGLLAAKGIRVSPQAIWQWFDGGGIRLSTLLALLDILDIRGEDRDAAILLHAKMPEAPVADADVDDASDASDASAPNEATEPAASKVA